MIQGRHLIGRASLDPDAPYQACRAHRDPAGAQREASAPGTAARREHQGRELSHSPKRPRRTYPRPGSALRGRFRRPVGSRAPIIPPRSASPQWLGRSAQLAALPSRAVGASPPAGAWNRHPSAPFGSPRAAGDLRPSPRTSPKAWWDLTRSCRSCTGYSRRPGSRGSAHPELIEQGAPLGVSLVVARAVGDDVEPEVVHEWDPRRLVDRLPVGLLPQG